MKSKDQNSIIIKCPVCGSDEIGIYKTERVLVRGKIDENGNFHESVKEILDSEKDDQYNCPKCGSIWTTKSVIDFDERIDWTCPTCGSSHLRVPILSINSGEVALDSKTKMWMFPDSEEVLSMVSDGQIICDDCGCEFSQVCLVNEESMR